MNALLLTLLLARPIDLPASKPRTVVEQHDAPCEQSLPPIILVADGTSGPRGSPKTGQLGSLQNRPVEAVI
jgi:hypothetical protein